MVKGHVVYMGPDLFPFLCNMSIHYSCTYVAISVSMLQVVVFVYLFCCFCVLQLSGRELHQVGLRGFQTFPPQSCCPLRISARALPCCYCRLYPCRVSHSLFQGICNSCTGELHQQNSRTDCEFIQSAACAVITHF